MNKFKWIKSEFFRFLQDYLRQVVDRRPNIYVVIRFRPALPDRLLKTLFTKKNVLSLENKIWDLKNMLPLFSSNTSALINISSSH